MGKHFRHECCRDWFTPIGHNLIWGVGCFKQQRHVYNDQPFAVCTRLVNEVVSARSDQWVHNRLERLQ